MAAGLSVSLFTNQTCPIQVLAACFTCLLLSLFHRDQRIISGCVVMFFFVWGLFALTPWFSPVKSPASISNKVSGAPATVEGIVAGRPSVTADGSRVVVETESIISENRIEPVCGLLLLSVSQGEVSLVKGDRIRFVTQITLPHRLGLPGEFDYPRYLSFQGITATGRVVSQQDIVMIRAAAEESVQRSIDIVARTLGDTIRQAVPDVRISSVLTALLLGDQKRIPENLADAYTRAGVTHILSISGFHVGIIATFISLISLGILSRFESLALRWNVRRISVLIAIPSMVSYLFLTGNAPATARSVIMLVACAVALYVERETDAINMLLLAACLLISINPVTLFDVSFQLSFLSLWGIIITVPVLSERFSAAVPRRSLVFIQLLAASIAASFVTLIPVLHTFKVASLNGILANFLIVPLLGYGAVISGFCVLPLIVLVPDISGALLWPSTKLIHLSNMIVEWFSVLPVIHFTRITAWDMFFFLLFMLSVTFVRGVRGRFAFAAVMPLAAVMIHATGPSAADGRLHVTMLSVGQAESMFLGLPDGSTMLVDGGGYLQDNGRDFGRRILLPALESLGIRRIDRLIITHDHPDHIGGLSFVVKNITVGECWTTSGTYSRLQHSDLRSVLSERKIPVRLLAAGESINLASGVDFKVFSPGQHVIRKDGDDIRNTNEDSLVFRISFAQFSMLFTADAGFDAERKMISRGSDLESTVLKVGHHGSAYSTSEEFVDLVRPRMALISAGAGNTFGLPSGRTIDLLKAKSILVYRTDRDGTIELASDGKNLNVYTRYGPD